MKFNNHVLSIITFLAFAFILSSCNQKLYITPINLETFYQKTTGITEKEDAEISKNIFTALIDNTVEKHLPSTKVFSLSGEEYDLAKLIEGKTIIVSSDPYCAAGMASLFEYFTYSVFQGVEKIQ